MEVVFSSVSNTVTAKKLPDQGECGSPGALHYPLPCCVKVSLGLAQICLSGRLTTTDLLQDRAGASVSLVQLISS